MHTGIPITKLHLLADYQSATAYESYGTLAEYLTKLMNIRKS